MARPSDVTDPESRDRELMEAARQATKHSYCPFSKFRVGAALLTADGSVYTGTNIENINFGSSICAERVAMAKAITEGHRSFTRLAVVSPDAPDCFPCGVCRQFISEFGERLIVLTEAADGHIKTVDFSSLLPTLESLER